MNGLPDGYDLMPNGSTSSDAPPAGYDLIPPSPAVPASQKFDTAFSPASDKPEMQPALETTAARAAPAPSWSEIPGKALANAPSSALNLASSMVQPFIHPVQTANEFYQIGQGLASKAGLLSQDPADKAKNEAAVNSIGRFFADRYGSIDNLKKTLATDPAGALADVATILTGGEAALARVPGMVGEIGRAAGTVGRAVDPVRKAVNLAGNVAVPAVRYGVGYPLALATGIVTGKGPTSILESGRAGLTGDRNFARQLRDDSKTYTNVPIDMAESAMAKLVKARSDAYNSGMVSVKSDLAPLDFTPINKAVADAGNKAMFHGLVKSKDAVAVHQEIKDLVDAWQNQPMEIHPQTGWSYFPHQTAEGLDALKQSVNDVRYGPNAKPGTLARKIADDVYHTVKSQIVKQAPQYANVMLGYSDASDKLAELRKTLSLNDKASNDTKLRKLLSSTRIDVQSNFGERGRLVDELEKHTPGLKASLYGQAMHPILPGGLAKLGPVAEVGGALAALKVAAAAKMLPVLAASSPRLVGEAAYGLGRVANAAGQLPGIAIGRGAWQLGRLPTDNTP